MRRLAVMKRILSISAMALFMAVTGWADKFGFGNITTNAPNREVIAGQLFMDANTLSDTSSSITFINTGPSSSSISEIYFGSNLTTLDLNIESAISYSPGVLFDLSGAHPANPPGWDEVSHWWPVTIASAESKSPTSKNGINPYECLEMELSYNSSLTLSELIQSGDVQVALHVISIGAYSDAFVNGPALIPEPASLILMGSAGCVLGFVRRRFFV
jgi:hypothetical protein